MDYAFEYCKGSAKVNADFQSRFPEPAAANDRTGSSSLTPAEDGGMFPVRACGLRTRSSPTPGVGLSGLVSRPARAVLGRIPFLVLDVLEFCSTRATNED